MALQHLVSRVFAFVTITTAFFTVTPAWATEYLSVVEYRAGGPTVQQTVTTSTPATYTIGADGESATSTTSSATGGSAFASAVTSDRDPNRYALASSFVRYTITLSGPAGTIVPVSVFATGYADGSGTTAQGERIYNASSGFTLRSDAIFFTPIFATADTSTGPGRQSFTVNTVALLTPNVSYAVELFARAGTNGFLPSTAEAFSDPVFTVDPAFASLYQLLGVPQAVSAPVPEPATWIMLIFGFALTGSAMRRRAPRSINATG
jgi:PEP-CTERM motif